MPKYISMTKEYTEMRAQTIQLLLFIFMSIVILIILYVMALLMHGSFMHSYERSKSRHGI